MSTRAKFIKEVEVIDPDSKGVVHMAVYKHQYGGMFAIDSSFITECREDESDAIYDPFAEMGEPEALYLEE